MPRKSSVSPRRPPPVGAHRIWGGSLIKKVIASYVALVLLGFLVHLCDNFRRGAPSKSTVDRINTFYDIRPPLFFTKGRSISPVGTGLAALLAQNDVKILCTRHSALAGPVTCHLWTGGQTSTATLGLLMVPCYVEKQAKLRLGSLWMV